MDWNNPWTMTLMSGSCFIISSTILIIRLRIGNLARTDHYRLGMLISSCLLAGMNVYEPWGLISNTCNALVFVSFIDGIYYINFAFYFMYLIDRLMIVYESLDRFRSHTIIIGGLCALPVLAVVVGFNEVTSEYCGFLPTPLAGLYIAVLFITLDFVILSLFLYPILSKNRIGKRSLSHEYLGLIERIAIQQFISWLSSMFLGFVYSGPFNAKKLSGFLGPVASSNVTTWVMWTSDVLGYFQRKQGKTSFFLGKRLFSVKPALKENCTSVAIANITVTLTDETEKVLYIPAYLSTNCSYQIIKQIGKGGSGTVYHVDISNDKELVQRSEGFPIAVKIAPRKSEFDIFNTEVAIMSLFSNHENFARIIGFNEQKMEIFMVYYTDGSLREWILQKNGISRKIILPVILFIGIVSAIKEMHKIGIVHNDLKPDNILLVINNNSITAKLIDFGVANIVKKQTLLKVPAFRVSIRLGLSVPYAAPERFHVANTRQAAFESDIYSFAIIVYEVMNKNFAWMNDVDRASIIPDPVKLVNINDIIIPVVLVNACTETMTVEPNNNKSKKIPNPLVKDSDAISFTETSSREPSLFTSSKKTIGMELSNIMSIPGYLSVLKDEYTINCQICYENYLCSANPKSELYNRLNQDTVDNIKTLVAKQISPENNAFHQEVSIMAMLTDNPNFATLVGYDESSHVILLIYYPEKSLKEWIPHQQTMSSQTKYDIMVGLANGIESLHSSGITHNNLSLSNILVEKLQNCRYNTRITGFSLANIVDGTVLNVRAFKLSNSKKFSAVNTSPERILKQFPLVSADIAKKADIYGFSLIIYSLVHKTIDLWN